MIDSQNSWRIEVATARQQHSKHISEATASDGTTENVMVLSSPCQDQQQ
jgi:hypothetical protein